MVWPLMVLGGELLINFDDVANFTFGDTGTPAHVNSADNVLEGNSSIEFSILAAEKSLTKKAGLALDLTKYHSVTLWYYLHANSAASANMVIKFITDASGETNKWRYGQQLTTNIGFNTDLGKGWNAWTISFDDLILSAAGDLSDIKQIYVDVDSVDDMTITLDSLYAHQYAKPKLCFVFDDANDSDLTEAYDYMYTQQEAIKTDSGIIGTSAIYVDGIGGANRLTVDNCLTMKSDGWCFVNHSDDNTELDSVTTAEAIAKLDTCRDFIESNGLDTNGSKNMVVYPGGKYTSDLIDAMPNGGYTFGRIATQKNAPNQFITHPSDIAAQSINQRLCSLSSDLISTFAIATFRAEMEDLTKYGGIGFIMVHKIVASGATGIETNRADFRSAVDYAILLQQRGLIDIVSVEKAINE